MIAPGRLPQMLTALFDDPSMVDALRITERPCSDSNGRWTVVVR